MGVRVMIPMTANPNTNKQILARVQVMGGVRVVASGRARSRRTERDERYARLRFFARVAE
jgi:hypothetical protein